MISFQKILKNHHLDSCPQYLWEIRVTDKEYEELRNLLVQQSKSSYNTYNNRFITVTKECVLYFAEYWRREYQVGAHSVQMVLESLGLPSISNELRHEFYEASQRGFKVLKLELFEDNGVRRFLDSMLYQGGLPMKLVTSNENDGVWDRFIRGLVNRRINFEELNLGIVAARSRCMREYCKQLILGIERECHQLMPFYCINENDVWFLYLKELATQERIRRQQLRPFSLDWEFRVDTVEKKIYTKYTFKGLQRLPQAFLEEQTLDNLNFFSVQVRKNGQAVDTFDYANNFSHHAVFCKDLYENGDYISIFLHNQEDAHIGDNLDMSVPHLLYRNKDGKYELGNQMGRQESLILIPEGWNVQSETNLNVDDYVWCDITLQGLHIPAEYTENIVIQGKDGCITFGMNAPLYWTELQSHPLYLPNVIESLYDANSCEYALCYDTEDGMDSKRSKVQYRNKWQNDWSDTPSYGEIFARAIDDSKVNFVTPLRFINIGDGLVISLQNADKDSCKIRVVWAHGQVATNEGKRKGDNVWEIKREKCHDPRKIRFTLTPENNCNNQFDLSIKAPFKDFAIKNIYGDDIEDDCWIPYSDIDKYQYHLVGQNIREYTYGNVTRELRWIEDRLFIRENDHNLRSIPYEGSLLTLFDSREVLRSLLERTSQNMLKAEINVQFVLTERRKISFGIKDSPFRPRQIQDGRVVITGKNNKHIKFNDVLKLLKLEDPNLAAIKMSVDESGYYSLPDDIRPWGKTIVIGQTRGRICPALVDLTREMDGSDRANNRKSAIETIKGNLKNSKLGDELWQRIIGWFNRTQKEDIPASYILELYCVAQDYRALLCLAFQLYVKTRNDEQDILKEKLKIFSNDLAFQWYWLQPHLSGLFTQLRGFMSDPSTPAMQEIYIKWAMGHEGADMVQYLSALNDAPSYDHNLAQCFNDIMNSFTTWLNELCVLSLVEAYEPAYQEIIQELAIGIIANPQNTPRCENNEDEYIEANQDDLGDEVVTFFGTYAELGRVGNEAWLYKRVNAVVAHIRQEIDLFSKTEEIRRSIIFCSKSSNHHFVISLNNKLRR